MLDFLFVNQPSPDKDIIIRDINRSGRKTRERMIWPQTNLAYLAAVMQKEGYTVDIIDCIALGMDWAKFRTVLEEKKSRYLVANAISTVLTNDMYAMFLAKSLGSTTIAMGPHVTAQPIDTMNRFPSLDFIVRGEAEITLKELVYTLEKGGDLQNVKGIAFRHDNTVIVTDERPFIENLDDLPMPLHELLPLKKYRMPFFGSYTFVVAGRGCPFRCIFCRQTVMWKGKVRTRSAESIFKEVLYLKDLGMDTIMFQADTFTANRRMVIELCKKIIDSGIKIRWVCNTHVATIDEEMIDLMKKAGCWMIAPGIETGSQIILDNVKKRATLEQIHNTVNLIHKKGIQVWGYFIFGLPGETKETIKETISLARKLPLDMANFAIGAPYPGTEFYTMAKEKGWLTMEKWEGFDQNYSAIVDYGYLTPADVVRAMKKANILFFLRLRTIKTIIKGIKGWDSVRDLWSIFWRHFVWIIGRRES